MAIRDVVTRGFGNGTYDPGVNDLPTRGYTIGAVSSVTADVYFPVLGLTNALVDTRGIGGHLADTRGIGGSFVRARGDL